MSDSGTSGGAVPFTRVAIPTFCCALHRRRSDSAEPSARGEALRATFVTRPPPVGNRGPRRHATGGSLIFHSECQMRYITQVLDLLIAGGHRSVEPRADKAREWHERSQAEMRKLVWSQPSVKHSFYKNAFGEVHILSPWRLVDYWAWTREPNPDDFVIR